MGCYRSRKANPNSQILSHMVLKRVQRKVNSYGCWTLVNDADGSIQRSQT